VIRQFGVARLELGPQLRLLQKIQHCDSEARHHAIRKLRLQPARSFEHMVNLRLGDPQKAGESTLRVFAVLYSHIYEFNKSRLKSSKRDRCS
jgi:hypothetical protein